MASLKRGFTLIELMVVVAIIAILATIATSAYSKYHTAALEDEATAGLQALANEASRLIADWGISDGHTGSITKGCFAPNPPLSAFKTASTATWDSELNGWKTYDIALDGTHHWQYQLCFYIDSSTSAEEYFILSTLNTPGANPKYGVLDSNRRKPFFTEKPTIPSGVTLTVAGD